MTLDCRVSVAKVRDYLLNPDHEDCGPKSAFFCAHGFVRDRHHLLADALVEHFRSQPVISTVRTVHGEKLIVEGPLRAPDGRSPRVRSIWIRDADDRTAVFVTAVPR